MRSGSMSFLVGLAIIIFFGSRADLKCDRSESKLVACEFTSSNLLSTSITPIPLGQLISAKVEESSSTDGSTYRVLLFTKNGTIPMTIFFSNGIANHQKDADEINNFLKGIDRSSLQIHQDSRWFAYTSGGIFALIGGVFIYASIFRKIQTSCVFDKTAGRMFLNEQILWQTETREFFLHDIKEVQILEDTDSDGDKTYRTQAILKSGEKILLQISSPISTHPKVVESINQFLNISPHP
jgi:hypothetical protein